MTAEISLMLSGENPLAFSFLQKQALERKYHTLFGWRDKNANSFFGLFGEEFKSHITGIIKEDPQYQQEQKDFLELGNLRNMIVHEGIHSYSLQRDINSVYQLFENSLNFSIFFCKTLCEFFHTRCSP